jgi:MFS family permease
MLSAYRGVFRAPGTAAFTVAGFVMGLPIAIYPIGLVLTVSARTGHYGLAGVASGMLVVGGVPGAPLLSRLADRHGQRRVMVPATIVHVCAVAVTVALLISGAPVWTALPSVFVVGFTYVSVGSLIRARWSSVLAGRPADLTTAYSLASTLDEAIFVLGPLLATLVAAIAPPVVALCAAGTLVAVGGTWLSSQRATEPAVGQHDGVPHRSALRAPGMIPMLLATVFMGAVFASAEVSDVAFCGQHGHRNVGGLVVAMWALGSGLSGFIYGSRQRRGAPAHRFRRQAVIFGALPLLFLLASNIPVLAVISFVAGFGTAPALIAAFGLVERLVPPMALTEGLTWVQVGLSVGFGTGAALVGGIADAHGARTSFVVAAAAGIAVAITAVAAYRLVSRASADAGQTSVGPSEHAALP